MRTLHPGFPFEKVKATLVDKYLHNTFILSSFFSGASVLKDVGSSSLKVKGSIETARDREMEKKEPREASRVGREGKGPVYSVFTMFQALSQVFPRNHMFLVLLSGSYHSIQK